MPVHYQLTEADWVTIRRAMVVARLRLYVLAVVALVAVGALVTAGLTRDWLAVAIFFGLMPFALLAAWFWILPRTWRRAFRRIPEKQLDVTFHFSPDGLTFDSPVGHTSADWSLWSHYQDTDELILLHQATWVVVALPKRALAADELSRLQELLAANLPRRRPPRRPAVAPARRD